MNRFIPILIFFFLLTLTTPYASEIDYRNCRGILETLSRETEEISSIHPTDHDELAQLYVSRGESYLLNAEYDKAIEDFQNANAHIGRCRNVAEAIVIAFRVAFGQVVSYDNLGMDEHTQEALEQLNVLATHISYNDCIEYHPCERILPSSTRKMHFQDWIKPTLCNIHFSDLIVSSSYNRDKKSAHEQAGNQDSYEDILGPIQPPASNWCEEVVTGVGRAMDAIACLAPNYAVKVALIGVIEALITRGVKCCQAGGFWKACVAPITRKWNEWNSNKENAILPNAKNLPLYISTEII